MSVGCVSRGSLQFSSPGRLSEGVAEAAFPAVVCRLGGRRGSVPSQEGFRTKSWQVRESSQCAP